MVFSQNHTYRQIHNNMLITDIYFLALESLLNQIKQPILPIFPVFCSTLKQIEIAILNQLHTLKHVYITKRGLPSIYSKLTSSQILFSS